MPNRIPSLDGLRAISILLVIVGHASGKNRLNDLAIFGVHIFFVISGFLITSLLQDEYSKTGKINLLAFYRRRCFRIFPAAFAYIFIIGALVPSSRSGLPYVLTYTVSWHVAKTPIIFFHLWSLSIEEQFYALWPLVLLLSFRNRAKVAWGAVLFSGMFRLCIALGVLHLGPEFIHFSFPGCADSIAAGCLLAIYEPRIKARLGWMTSSPAIALAAVACAHTLAGLFWGYGNFVGLSWLCSLWGIVPILIALFVWIMIERRDWILNNRVAVIVGVGSYSIYLWQQPFTYGTLPRPLAFSLVAVLAAASYYMVERPMIAVGRRLSPAPSPKLSGNALDAAAGTVNA